MNSRLPWWLVILGWAVYLVVAIQYFIDALVLLAVRAGLPYKVDGAWYLILLGGAMVILVPSDAIGRRAYWIARAHRGGCALTIATPVLLLFLDFLLFLPRCPPAQLCFWFGPFFLLFDLLGRHGLR
jgi:hypothetical protein